MLDVRQGTRNVEETGSGPSDSPAGAAAGTERFVAASRELSRLFWDAREDALVPYLDPDVVFLAPDASLQRGSQAIAKAILQVRRSLSDSRVVVDESYEGMALAGGCVVIARYTVRLQPNTPEEKAATFRATLLWRDGATGDDAESGSAQGQALPQLYFCQAPLQFTNVPQVTHDATEQPSEVIARRGPHGSVLQAHDASGQVHWVNARDVVFVQAAHQYTNVHCTDRTLRLHDSFGNVTRQLEDVVVNVHRSYAVNPLYVRHLEHEMLYLTTGEKVPVPAKRLRQVRMLLAERCAQLGKRD